MLNPIQASHNRAPPARLTGTPRQVQGPLPVQCLDGAQGGSTGFSPTKRGKQVPFPISIRCPHSAFIGNVIDREENHTHSYQSYTGPSHHRGRPPSGPGGEGRKPLEDQQPGCPSGMGAGKQGCARRGMKGGWSKGVYKSLSQLGRRGLKHVAPYLVCPSHT